MQHELEDTPNAIFNLQKRCFFDLNLVAIFPFYDLLVRFILLMSELTLEELQFYNGFHKEQFQKIYSHFFVSLHTVKTVLR